jgi:hypothetical protein
MVACRTVSRQRFGKHVPAATDTHATREVLLETVFLLGPCKGVIRRTIEARRGSWKGVTVQRGLEHGRRGITIVINSYQETSSEDTAGRGRLSVYCTDF